MFLRKWVVRGLVFSILGGILALAYVYQRWTNPGAVRRQVVLKLREMFPSADVTLDAAHLRLLGGIGLSELRLTRKDDPDKTELAYLPSGIIFHDKEQLLDGKLAIRKLELHRPRLHIIRRPDGTWNIAGLQGTRSGKEPLPTIVIVHGTILVDDQLACPGTPPVEISDVSLTVLNDPHSITFEGLGKSILAGALQASGTWRRDTRDLALHMQAGPIPLNPSLLRRLGRYSKDLEGHARDLEGTGQLRADVTYRPQAANRWGHDVHFQLADGRLRHPLLPVALDHMEGAIRCVDGLVTSERLTAQLGQATARLTGGRLYRQGSSFVLEAQGDIEHLVINKELCEHLPEKLKKLDELFRPAGRTNVSFDICRQEGKWTRQHWVLHPEGMSACFAKFEYPLDKIRGTLDMLLHEKRTLVDLTAYTGAVPVSVTGSVVGEAQNAEVKIDIKGKDVPLDEKLTSALPPLYQQVTRKLHVQGRADIIAKVRHGSGKETYDNHYALDIHHAALKWEPFPYPLENVSAHLEIFPEHWELSRFRGVRNKGELLVSGRSFPPLPGHSPLDAQIKMAVTGKNVQLDGDLKAALQPFPGMSKAWNTFGPVGQMSFAANIDRLPKQVQDLDVIVEMEGCTVCPLFFPYRLQSLNGRFHYAKSLLTMTGVSAWHGHSHVRIPQGKVDLYPDGSFFADLTDLQIDPLTPDEDLSRALPGPLRKTWDGLKLGGALGLRTRLVVSQKGQPGVKPDLFWDGRMWLRNATLQAGLPLNKVTGSVACRGRHNGQQIQGISCNVELDDATLLGQPFHDIHTRIDVYEKTPDVVVLGLQAPFFGGQISGPVRLELGSSVRYELDLTASEVNLGAFGRHNMGPHSQLSGILGGRLHLAGKGPGISSLDGNGSLDMPKGHLYNLPVLLDLLKFLGLRWPDRTAFDQAHAAFSIHGERVSFSQLELYGNAISLHGQGDMKLDGTDVHLDFIPVWGRIEQVLPPVWQPLPSTIGKNLLKIEVRGKLGDSKDLKFHKKPVPGVLDPLVQMRDRLVGAAGGKK